MKETGTRYEPPTRTGPRVLVIDNYDSFTYNLVQMFGATGVELVVWRNDAFELDELARERGHELNVDGRHDLRDDEKTVGFSGLLEELQAVLTEPLKSVGRGSGLEGSAPQYPDP